MKTNKIYYYEIGWGNCDSSSYITLTSKAKYTKTQLNKIIQKAFKNLLNKKELENEYKINFSHINNSIINELTRNFNFKKLRYQSTYKVFGSPNILDLDDWKGERDKELDQLYNTAEKRLKQTEENIEKELKKIIKKIKKKRLKSTKQEDMRLFILQNLQQHLKNADNNRKQEQDTDIDDIEQIRKQTETYTKLPNQINKTLKQIKAAKNNKEKLDKLINETIEGLTPEFKTNNKIT